jgi:outer membrane protein OmpA-like peptidoglycan-associated protein
MLSLLKKEPNSLLYVLGYADAQGSAKANLDLAAERARAVRNFLLDRDIEVERIRLYVYGETEAGAVEDAETIENEFERSQLRQRYRCAVLVWKRQ